MADDKEFIDAHLDAILKASGSGLKNYSMHQTREGMRKALRAALAAATAPQQPAQDKPAAEYPGLPKWIDMHKGSDPTLDNVIAYCEALHWALDAAGVAVGKAVPEGFALTLVDRSYDQRVAAIIAHNQCKGDLDDKLDAAYRASLAAAPAPDRPAP